MAIRNIYLKIERILGYDPVAPQDEMGRYHRDCARNPGHEDGRIPDGEVALRRVDALVYREYLDAGYTMPNMAPLIANDVNEPMADRRGRSQACDKDYASVCQSILRSLLEWQDRCAAGRSVIHVSRNHFYVAVNSLRRTGEIRGFW